MTNVRDMTLPACHILGGVVLLLLVLPQPAKAAPAQAVGTQPPIVATVVPPNVLMALSIEYPTAGQAYRDDFDWKKDYIGYFDSRKCYEWVEDWMAYPRTIGYFQARGSLDGSGFCPVADVNDRSEYRGWSGNLLNWAMGTALDVFRLVMTGGNRARYMSNPARYVYGAGADESGFTFISRSRLNGHGEPNKTVDAIKVRGRMPARFTNKSKVIFNSQGSGNAPANATRVSNGDGERFDFYGVVKACEENFGGPDPRYCRQYKNGWKPEGLIQRYAREMRFGVMSYLNINDQKGQDGGVLRARLKFPGQDQTVSVPGVVGGVALGVEWDAETGVQYNSPDKLDATESGVSSSGVINAINRFGDASGYKTYDPGAELFYAAQRYFRNKGHYASYSNNMNNYGAKDNFPVITRWDDPILHTCQKNFLIYLGDTNTHYDTDLPGSTSTSKPPSDDRPNPADESQAPNVHKWLQKIQNNENSNGVSVYPDANTGAENSRSYMAALAYWANSVDIRADLLGKQTIKTFTIDVVENGLKKSEGSNAFYLAGKYGGFTDRNGNGVPDEDAEWKNESYKNSPYAKGMPKNFAQAQEPQAMVDALTTAIEQVSESKDVPFAGQGSNSPTINTQTQVYRGSFQGEKLNSTDENLTWSGELEARTPDSWRGDALVPGLVLWRGSEHLPHPVLQTWNAVSMKDAAFSVDQTWLVNKMRLSADTIADAKARIAWVAGSRGNEADGAKPALRKRRHLLGTIINSAPLFHEQPGRLGRVAGCTLPGTLRSEPLLAVGANDGVFHVFGAKTDRNNFGYVPGAVLERLSQSTQRDFEHDYLVDGTPIGGLVCLGEVKADDSEAGKARSVLVSSTGLGGRAVFALDTTAPLPSVLWEFSAADDADLGLTVANPKLVRVKVGTDSYRDAVIVGNGLNSASGRAALFILFIDKPKGQPWVAGRHYVKLLAGEDTSGDDVANGLMSPSELDVDGDGVTEFVYAGDINGRLWKFDLRTPGNWGVVDANPLKAGTQPLFSAKLKSKAQAIVAAPLLQRLPGDSVRVLFGTGKMFSGWDEGGQQSLYGVVDDGSGELTSLSSQTLSLGSRGSIQVNNVPAGKHGWRIDLNLPVLAEARVIRPAASFGSLVEFEAVMPSTDVCEPGAKTVLFRLRPGTGNQSTAPVFDTNGDGIVDGKDSAGGGWLSGALLPSLPPAYKVVDGVLLQQSREGVVHQRVMRQLVWRELLGVEE